MNIPCKVKIGGVVYKVKLLDDFVDKREDGAVELGKIDYLGSVIYVTKKMSVQHQKQTLLHEIVHGILDDRQMFFDGKLESVVDNIANGLLQLIEDNPKMFKGE